MFTEGLNYIKSKLNGFEPQTAIILGSGLGALADDIESPIYIDYSSIPNFPVSTAPSHIGRFVFGTLCGKKVVCMQGRLHMYEGYSAQQITMPVRIMRLLGAETLIVTNAAGGIDKNFKVGDIMLIEDHINLQCTNATIGKNDDNLGKRFFDMTYAYNPQLRKTAERAANTVGVDLKHGVYVGLLGPSYETPAEIRMFGILGGNAVGMSTVQEVIVANHMSMRVLGLSLITNMAAGITKEKLTLEEVVEVGKERSQILKQLVREILQLEK